MPASKLSDYAVNRSKRTPSPKQATTPTERKPDKPAADVQQMIVRIPVEAKRQLGHIKADTGESLQDLTREALNLLFEKRGLAQVA